MHLIGWLVDGLRVAIPLIFIITLAWLLVNQRRSPSSWPRVGDRVWYRTQLDPAGGRHGYVSRRVGDDVVLVDEGGGYSLFVPNQSLGPPRGE